MRNVASIVYRIKASLNNDELQGGGGGGGGGASGSAPPQPPQKGAACNGCSPPGGLRGRISTPSSAPGRRPDAAGPGRHSRRNACPRYLHHILQASDVVDRESSSSRRGWQHVTVDPFVHDRLHVLHCAASYSSQRDATNGIAPFVLLSRAENHPRKRDEVNRECEYQRHCRGHLTCPSLWTIITPTS